MKTFLICCGMIVAGIGLFVPNLGGSLSGALLVCGAIFFTGGLLGGVMEDAQAAAAKSAEAQQKLLAEIRDRLPPR
jgi:hypothetical protein